MQPGARHLYFPFFVIILRRVLAEQSQVHWVSPSAGDSFGSGDNLNAKWTANKAVVSPSFKLCQGSTQSSLNTRAGQRYIFNLADDAKHNAGRIVLLANGGRLREHLSLTFVLAITSAPEPPERAIQSSPAGTQDSSQSPLSVDPKVHEAPAAPLVTVTSPPISSAAMASAVGSQMTATRSPPTAAFAIPLSIVGAILLAAIVVAIRQNRMMGTERALDIQRLKQALSRSSSLRGSGYKDIENCGGAYGCTTMMPMPVPLFMPPLQTVERKLHTKGLYKDYASSQYTLPPLPYRSAAPSYRSSSRPASIHRVSAPTSSSRRSMVSSHRSTISSKTRMITSNFREPETTPVTPLPLTRPPSRVSSISSRTLTTRSLASLPPIQAGPALYDQNRLGLGSGQREIGDHDVQCSEGDVTDLILDDYMLPSRPSCLLPAPHLEASACGSEKEISELKNPYDAVAASLRNGRLKSV
uniref:Uncharacterized protein n=1 Tax=Moniliophthora roreri TaxID=221103 RepID=A0A0W0F5C1_MONRR